MTRVPGDRMRAPVALLAAGVAIAVAFSTAHADAATRPTAPRLVDLTAAAGSSAAVAAPSGALPSYFLSAGTKRTAQSIALKARRAQGQVGLAIPLSTPGDSYRVLACQGQVCAASAKPLLVTPRLTHLLPPLQVHSTLAGSPVSKALTADQGGTLVAHGPGGTTYTLVIPADALPDDTTVSIQPISTVSGISGVTGEGVRIEPDGLQLATAASLTVSKPPTADAGDLVTGLTVSDSGRGPALVPAVKKGAGYLEPVLHFSDHDTVTGHDLILDAIARHAAERAQDQFFSQAAEAVARGDAEGAGRAILDNTAGYYDQVVRPLLVDALNRDSSSSAVAAVVDAITYLHASALIGADGDGLTLERLGISKEMFTYLISLEYRNAYNSCAAGGLKNGPHRLLGVARQAQLVGLTDLFNDVFDDIAKCFTFRLDFDSDVALTDAGGGDRYHVVAPITVHGRYDLSDLTFHYTGTGPLTYQAATGHEHSTQDSCGGIYDDTDIVGTTPSTASVVMKFDPFTATDADPKLSVGVDPGVPTETYHESGTECPDGSAFDTTTAAPFWLFYWGSVLHHQQASSTSADGESGPPWVFGGFTSGSSDVIGTKTSDQEVDITEGDDDDTGHLSEHTTITLTHTPGPAPSLPAKPTIPPVK